MIETTEITGLTRLYWQDNRDMIKTVPDKSIDLILTDPPYNIAKYSSGNITLPNRTPINNDISQWDLEEVDPLDYVEEFKRILKPNGNIFIFTSYNSIGKWHSAFDHKFDTAQYMVWHKTNPTPNIYKTSFLKSCELIICFWNKGHVWNFSTQDKMHNFIETPICSAPERLKNPKHPAQKPVKLLQSIIELASNKGAVVFDPFMGVASTGIAALKTGRIFYGCELQEDYYRAGVERIKQFCIQNRI